MARTRKMVVLGTLVGIFAAGLILLLMGRRAVLDIDTEPTGAVLPEASRPMNEVVLHYVPEAYPLVEDAYTDFLRALPTSVRVVLVVPRGMSPSQQRQLQERLAAIDPSLPTRIQKAEAEGPITTWSKDRALVTTPPRPGAAARLLVPAEPSKTWRQRYNDWSTPAAIAAASAGRYEVRVAPIDFDAGDFAIEDGTVIVDTNLLAKNRHRGIGNVIELRKRVSAWLEMPVVVLGQEPGDTPRHHLAMYMAPLGGKVALVGDPRWARTLVGDAFEPGELSVETGEPLRADFSEAMTLRFERAADDLRRYGYQVVRIPNVPFDHKTYLSYTNGVFEVRDGRRIAYVPVYEIEALDQAARDVYEKLGWEVRAIRVRSAYAHHGTIGCLVNVLGRGAGPEVAFRSPDPGIEVAGR